MTDVMQYLTPFVLFFQVGSTRRMSYAPTSCNQTALLLWWGRRLAHACTQTLMLPSTTGSCVLGLQRSQFRNPSSLLKSRRWTLTTTPHSPPPKAGWDDSRSTMASEKTRWMEKPVLLTWLLLLSSYWPTGSWGLQQWPNLQQEQAYYHNMPDRTLTQENEVDMSVGFKALKDRVTLLLACNCSRSHKMKPLLIEKYGKPRCFHHIPPLWEHMDNGHPLWRVVRDGFRTLCEDAPAMPGTRRRGHSSPRQLPSTPRSRDPCEQGKENQGYVPAEKHHLKDTTPQPRDHRKPEAVVPPSTHQEDAWRWEGSRGLPQEHHPQGCPLHGCWRLGCCETHDHSTLLGEGLPEEGSPQHDDEDDDDFMGFTAEEAAAAQTKFKEQLDSNTSLAELLLRWSEMDEDVPIASDTKDIEVVEEEDEEPEAATTAPVLPDLPSHRIPMASESLRGCEDVMKFCDSNPGRLDPAELHHLNNILKKIREKATSKKKQMKLSDFFTTTNRD